MTRRPNLKIADLSDAPLPANRPVLLESAGHAVVWQRERLNAIDERELIDAQIASATRTRDNTIAEATSVRDARIATADRAMEREVDDATEIFTATVGALQSRQSDLDRVIAGLSAAIDASGSEKSDGVQAE